MTQADPENLDIEIPDTGLAALVASSTRVLVLGSMPGQQSLAADQYYAHPRNCFWRVLDATTAVDAQAPYSQRVAAMLSEGVGLWDVVQRCIRPGSLDSAIRAESVVPNDFEALFLKLPELRRILFNGSKAAQLFNSHVLRPNPQIAKRLICRKLPSTSPANAAMPMSVKQEQWRDALLEALHAKR